MSSDDKILIQRVSSLLHSLNEERNSILNKEILTFTLNHHWSLYLYMYIYIYIYIRLKIKPNSVRIRF